MVEGNADEVTTEDEDRETVFTEVAEALKLWTNDLSEYVGFAPYEEDDGTVATDCMRVEIYDAEGNVIRSGVLAYDVAFSDDEDDEEA